MIKIGILGSGSGSNMQAILEATLSKDIDAEIAIVMSDNPDGYILERARKANIPTAVLDCATYKTKFPQDTQQQAVALLRQHDVDLICLAGFMRLVGSTLLDAFPERILNIHPSLLPAYPGLMAWKQAVQDGASKSGCTVHLVDGGMDTGAILLQAEVPVSSDDTAESLHQKIQVEEHRLYPEAIQLWQKRYQN